MEESLVLMIPILALVIPIVAMILKHQRIMAGLESTDGKKGSAQARTLAVLTETLERQHERLKHLQHRVDVLETVLTDAQRDAIGPVLLADEPAREPATAPVPPRLSLDTPQADPAGAETMEEAVVRRNRDRA